jgi:hypothetical protein
MKLSGMNGKLTVLKAVLSDSESVYVQMTVPAWSIS